MARVVRDRGASGHDSIQFRQDLDYPRVPGAISYYPPEPSDELRKQVMKDKGGGLALYIIGVTIALIGLIAAMDFSQDIEIYATLIPLLLILGLVFAILYLVLDNVALATLARALPAILLVCLVLLYISSIFTAIFDLGSLIDGGNQNNISDGFENIFDALLNPAFFFMTAGLMISRAGGTMLWTSTKVVQQYIPGMIVLETPNARASPQEAAPAPVEGQETEPAEEEHIDAEPDASKSCQNCSQPMTFIEQYERYYCYDCEIYGDKEEDSDKEETSE